ncbi:SDR family NAD(P)-dependent oxidoreductase [Glaciibacter sp. 2TAF33]|uniref:SDR family NAD(P)-dependent oxidoreductase n=1 Tax=Glaciibacter sp. 2TAF33 TaxID=3233015 RepID=UPI003F92BA94
MSNLFSLDGKIALVVGAAEGGLGGRIARALSEQGATVSLADQPERAADLERTKEKCGPATTTNFCDVTDEQQVTSLFDAVIRDHARVDILVNAAGVMLRKAYNETSLEEFERVIGVNLTGTWLLNREAGKRMTAQASGKIVNLSTVYAERVGPVPESAYYASKAGIANVTRSLASELGRHGITVNCVAPGVFYPTQMTAGLANDPDQLDWFAQRTMLGRLGDPDRDIAGPVVLLASAASDYMTGQVVYVDGGWSAW